MASSPEASGSREEVDGLADGQRLDVRGLEADQPHARDDLLLELRILEFARHHATHRDLARRRDGEFEYEFAGKFGLVAQRAAIQRIQRTLVAIEHDLDFFACTRSLAARAGALHLAAGVRIESGAVLNLRRCMRADGPCTTTKATRHVGGVDAAAGFAGLRRDEVALRTRVFDRRLHLRIGEIEVLVTQRFEFVLEREHALVAHVRLRLLGGLLLRRLRLLGLGLFLLRRRRRRRWGLRLFDDELRDALTHVFWLQALRLSFRQQHDEDREQSRNDEQDAQQLFELALALFLERPGQLEAAEKGSEADAHAPDPLTSFSRWM